jgi:hypothetical protein
MDKVEAGAILSRLAGEYRALSYEELKRFLGNPVTLSDRSPSGVEYQIEIESVWDDAPDHNLRVLLSIDEGGLRPFAPIMEHFIVGPDGRFIGE